jgi:hypothetical protein
VQQAHDFGDGLGRPCAASLGVSNAGFILAAAVAKYRGTILLK